MVIINYNQISGGTRVPVCVHTAGDTQYILPSFILYYRVYTCHVCATTTVLHFVHLVLVLRL